MRDKELCAQILGTRHPWLVHDVELQLEVGEVIVHLELALDYALTCPLCGKAAPHLVKDRLSLQQFLRCPEELLYGE